LLVRHLVFEEAQAYHRKVRYSLMPKCFVIQPFDEGKYDDRYEDIVDPAIKDAGFNPYRVDRDPAVSIPIESIEKGIKESAILPSRHHNRQRECLV
jgi:hypothetical protein